MIKGIIDMKFSDLISTGMPVLSLITILFVVIFISISNKEGKDERGIHIFWKVYSAMLTLLSLLICLLIFLNSWDIVGLMDFRNLTVLSLCLTFIIGTVYLMIYKKRI
jgi:hypothetical protein